MAAGLLALGGLLSLAGLALVLWLRLGPRKPPQFPPPGPPPKLAAVTETATPFAPTAMTATPAPTPTEAAPYTYDGIDLGWAEPVHAAFAGINLLRPFVPYVWEPELDRDVFAIGSNHALAWEDSRGRIGLWVHSGDNQVASPLQEVIERDSNGYLVTHGEADKRLVELRGRGVQLQQGTAVSRSVVAAAVRVPPMRVNEVEGHVTDLVEYLAEAYPGFGFEDLLNRTEVMMFYFCGVRLGGEQASRASYYTQARFIVAIIPEAP